MRKVMLLAGMAMTAMTGLAIGTAVVGAIVGTIALRRALPAERRAQIRKDVSHISSSTLAKVKEHMPDQFAPMTIPSSIRRLQDQNEELLALIRDQNEMLREYHQSAEIPTAGKSD